MNNRTTALSTANTQHNSNVSPVAQSKPLPGFLKGQGFIPTLYRLTLSAKIAAQFVTGNKTDLHKSISRFGETIDTKQFKAELRKVLNDRNSVAAKLPVEPTKENKSKSNPPSIFKSWWDSAQEAVLEQKSFFDRLKDLGGDELSAFGLSLLTTSALAFAIRETGSSTDSFGLVHSHFDQASLFFSGHSFSELLPYRTEIVAFSSVVAEKIAFPFRGYLKARKNKMGETNRDYITNGIILAMPNLVVDILCHDSVYSALNYKGISEGWFYGQEWLTSSINFGVAVVAAAGIQHLFCQTLQRRAISRDLTATA